MNLGTLLSSDAQRHPDRTALVFDTRRVSYRELEFLSNRVANTLRARGVKVGDRVCVCLPNCVDLVVAICGVLKAGAVVVPVSDRLAPAEITVILEDCAPAAVIFPSRMRETVKAGGANLREPLMIADAAAWPGELSLAEVIAGGDPAPIAALPVEPDDALIGYTSGTTGVPKGAISTHANLIIGQGSMTAREWGLTCDDVILVTTPLAHRIGLARIANALCLGATLAVVSKFDPAQAAAVIEAEAVTVISVVPTIAKMLIPEIERRPEAFRSLRVVVATGESFPDDLQRRLMELLAQVRIYGFYSQTEAGFVASLAPEDRLTHPDSVGRAVPGVEIRIVDEAMRDVPAGAAGEILVRCGRPGQYSVMRAYHNRPAANAEVFVDGWLRTGDIGRMDEDRFLYFVGRAKDMVVSGGLNIYAREVEIALSAHPAVAEAAVIGVPDDRYGEAVMAYVQIAPGGAVTEAELIEHCRHRIAGYKKPKYVRFIDALPRNATGKIAKPNLRRWASADLPELFEKSGALARAAAPKP